MCDPDHMKPEPIPGLPEELPSGEDILWQGSPDWKSLALHVFHVRAVIVYFVLLAGWSLATGLSRGDAADVIASNAFGNLPFAVIGLGILYLLAWLIARSTIYTITTERVVIRAGVALPKAINIPFSAIGSASVKLRKNGNGDIPLETTGSDRIAYLLLWPHARPWRITKAQPMLRGLPAAADTAELLAGALAAKAGQPAPRLSLETEPDPVRGILTGDATPAGSSA